MQWYKISVHTTTESIEAVAELLNQTGANGVEIQDSADFKKGPSIGPFGETTDYSTIPHLTDGAIVTAYFPETKNLPELLNLLHAHLDLLPSYGLDEGSGEITVDDLNEEDWANAWKRYYHPTRITRYLTVVPNWEHYKTQDPGEQTIILDPGMSFGTGTHPTTTLALLAMEKCLRGGETVFDIGTGSGILSLAASKLGAKTIQAYDLDDVAVRSAKANLNLNPDVHNITVGTSNLFSGVNGQADLILANILAEIIAQMIPELDRFLKPKGKVILSGIIKQKANDLIQQLAQHHFVVKTRFDESDWVALIVEREA